MWPIGGKGGTSVINEYHEIFGPKIWRTSEKQAAIGLSNMLH